VDNNLYQNLVSIDCKTTAIGVLLYHVHIFAKCSTDFHNKLGLHRTESEQKILR